MRQIRFRIDGLHPDTFEGFDSGQTWNGFAVPYFTRPAAEDFCMAFNAANPELAPLTVAQFPEVAPIASTAIYSGAGYAFEAVRA